jgi:hypothetical protein
MQINLSDEQILQIAEKQVLSLLRPRIEKVLKDSYWSSQDLKREIDNAIQVTIEKRVNQLVDDDTLKSMVKKQNISKVIADNLIKTVSEDITEQVSKLFD